jgi:hypothetical protein
MPLDPLQERIARTALALPQSRTLALAGGGAMIVHGFVNRPTKDIDLFTEIDDHEARQVVAALRHALEEQHLVTHDSERPPLDHRFIAIDPATGAECTVEVFADGGRLRDRVTLDLGPVLHPDDLAADKVLALWGRARPRDFFDVAALIDRYGHAYLSLPRPRTAATPHDFRRLTQPTGVRYDVTHTPLPSPGDEDSPRMH